MFSKEQLEQYSLVKAPDSLKAKVMKLESQKQAKVYKFPAKAVSAVAACLAVIIAIGAYFATGVDVHLAAAQYQTASYQRATAEERVTVKLDAEGKYEVSVSQGSFSVDDIQNVSTAQLEGDKEIEWLVPMVGENILTVKKGLIIRQYRLVFSYETQSLQLEKV